MSLAIDPSTTLADLVTAHPGLAPELERRSLDYCCGGRRSLADACAAAGLDPAEVLGALATAGEGSDDVPEPWADMDPAQLVDHIEATHHAFLHDELPRLSALAVKVADVHGGRHPELVEVARTYEELRADLEPHLAREERVLFPLIRRLVAGTTGEPRVSHCGSIVNPIRVMLAEHDRAGELLQALRNLTGGYEPPTDGCRSYQALYAGLAELEADTHLHVHKENNVLFPAVLAWEARLG
jgi:regulator of cell morphogenesis and NO signaling